MYMYISLPDGSKQKGLPLTSKIQKPPPSAKNDNPEPPILHPNISIHRPALHVRV